MVNQEQGSPEEAHVHVIDLAPLVVEAAGGFKIVYPKGYQVIHGEGSTTVLPRGPRMPKLTERLTGFFNRRRAS